MENDERSWMGAAVLIAVPIVLLALGFYCLAHAPQPVPELRKSMNLPASLTAAEYSMVLLVQLLSTATACG